MDMATNSWPMRLWQRTSLTQRLAFVALVPTLITATLLVTLLTRHQLITLHRMAQGTADARRRGELEQQLPEAAGRAYRHCAPTLSTMGNGKAIFL